MNQLLESPLDVWVPENFILEGARPHPILMHLSAPDTDSQLMFWNLLRDKLNNSVRVHKFKHLTEAGRVVVIPNPIQDYIYVGRFDEVLKLKNRVLASGRVPILTTGLEYFPRPGEVVFMLSTYRSTMSESTIPTPSWLYDFGSEVTPIPKPVEPTVGFVGAARYPGRLNALLSPVPIPGFITNSIMCNQHVNCAMYLGLRQVFARRLRERVLNEASSSPELKTSFITRKTAHFTQTAEEGKRAKEEYIQNIQNNAYTVCIRGTENYSYRLYETMSAGRIPIIIDTNVQLPSLNNFGDWREFSVLVPLAESHKIGSIVRKFHDSLSDEAFQQACAKSRAAFEYLAPHNFILRALQDRL
ncbi:MAG: hypothetical protein C4288_12995 [Leptolyngbya sp. ERB_1_1]